MEHKSQQIRSLIKRLTVDLEEQRFIINDHWDGDLLAIGISHPVERDLLVYIKISEDDSDYFVALEFPSSIAIYEPAGEFHNIEYAELVKVIRHHLGLYKHAL